MFNVILKYPSVFEKFLLTFRPTSRTLILVEMTLVFLYAEKERILTQPRRMLISSFFLENGTILLFLSPFFGTWNFFETGKCSATKFFGTVLQIVLTEKRDIPLLCTKLFNKRILLKHRCCSLIRTWGWFAKKFTVLCNTLRWSASTTSFNLQWMLGEKETRFQTLVLWQRQWKY